MLIPAAASAQTFSFNFFSPSVGGIAVTGTGFAGSSTGSDPFLLNSISGTLLAPGYGDGSFDITGLVAPGGAGGNDNLLSLSNPSFVTGGGVGFTLSDGAGRVNISFNGTNYVLTALDVGASGVIVAGMVTQIAAVPGPVAGAGLIPLLGLGAAWLVRRRKQLAA
jgi:MYXO-CTERM domain-containing protein